LQERHLLPAPAEAASVLLARGPNSSEVFVVRRALALRFFGGFLAFPGGRVAPSDVPSTGPVGPERSRQGRRTAAARELFEETGVLLARRGDGSFPTAGPHLETQRKELVDGRIDFAELLSRQALSVRAEDFSWIGDLITPAFSLTRFDTTFFTACLPAGQQPEVWPGELDEGRWATAADLLAEWTRGECLVSPPTLLLLEALHGRPVTGAPAHVPAYLARHHGKGLPTICFAPAVQMIPLDTPGLPPTTHTNAYLVGHGPAYLIDPGTHDAAEQQRLFDLLDAWLGEGRRLTAIVLSHHHPDHIGAANACARRYALPVWAHPRTAARLAGQVEVASHLHEGDRLDLGEAPDGRGSWCLEVLHTPGHASGHLAFYGSHYRLLFAGDLVSMLSSVVIAPPDGDLGDYLASLRRLCGYDCRLLLPSHGTPTANPARILDECIDHRVQRERQLLAALGNRPRTIEDLAAELYPGLPAELVRFACLQVLAGLEKLQSERRAEEVRGGSADGWVLR
jgi:glyoxylase-like metal-dependent hydrolase (beta-lactamase superfamily II)/8-oxo-dGTP pyrophosphatase MutT (NUDIX family)